MFYLVKGLNYAEENFLFTSASSLAKIKGHINGLAQDPDKYSYGDYEIYCVHERRVALVSHGRVYRAARGATVLRIRWKPARYFIDIPLLELEEVAPLDDGDLGPNLDRFDPPDPSDGDGQSGHRGF